MVNTVRGNLFIKYAEELLNFARYVEKNFMLNSAEKIKRFFALVLVLVNLIL
jgi:hypothetical protein